MDSKHFCSSFLESGFGKTHEFSTWRAKKKRFLSNSMSIDLYLPKFYGIFYSEQHGHYIQIKIFTNLRWLFTVKIKEKALLTIDGKQ